MLSPAPVVDGNGLSGLLLSFHLDRMNIDCASNTRDQLIITDMAGREVYRLSCTGRSEVDVSTWMRGSYMIILAGDVRIGHARIVLL